MPTLGDLLARRVELPLGGGDRRSQRLLGLGDLDGRRLVDKTDDTVAALAAALAAAFASALLNLASFFAFSVYSAEQFSAAANFAFAKKMFSQINVFIDVVQLN